MADRQYRYAQIIIDISHEKLDRPFTYRIPAALADQVEPGSRVRIPFGHAVRTGYVVELTDSCDLPEDKIREIGEVLLPGQGYSREKDSGFYIRLASWMKERYGATTITALKTVLTSRKTGKPKIRRQIRLLLDRDAAEEKLAFYHQKHQVARERLLRELIGTPVQPYDLITTRLHVGAPVIRAMKQAGVIEVDSYTDLRNPVSVSPDAAERKTLSPAQQRISDAVVESFEAGRPGVTLIRGITGSGKTEVYISIISRICRSGRQAIMLIPEIALTYQTLLRFYRHFGDRVSVINSSLSESEKADQWERARRGEIDVIIGPRSALFTPFERLGVIVIDEEHENSYKNESMPKYHARETAIQIARMRGACVVLGSATPSMESYYRALHGEYRLFTLDERLTGGSLPCTEITDMRMELRRGNRSILSRSLDSLIRDRLERGEQTMLFLNRRGFAGSVSCRSCGFVVKCPHCDVPMSLHRGGRMVCHYCGHQALQPKTCPDCGSPYISPFRAGTQQIETWLQEHFPGARILRMDA
ncbi:MAG TPA: primosomal protein N', partial [Lachnospiraceae bacterium]|nr:primosomal protein N' [Lachnospiraceae bacterium]